MGGMFMSSITRSASALRSLHEVGAAQMTLHAIRRAKRTALPGKGLLARTRQKVEVITWKGGWVGGMFNCVQNNSFCFVEVCRSAQHR